MKIGYVLLDGCGDRPVPSLNYTTPLTSAFTPNLDKIASRARLGSVTTVGEGVAPESDIAVFNMLGYSFEGGYPGRGVIEAVGAGARFRDGDLALRANFASGNGDRITDRRAGRNLSQVEAESLADDLKGVNLTDAEFEFRATVSYRGVLVIRAKTWLSAAISNTDPAYARVGGFGAAKESKGPEKVMKSVPEVKDDASALAARLVNEFAVKSEKILQRSDVNLRRLKQGKLPANLVLLRDAGDHLPVVPSFIEKYGASGTALVEMPAEVGIAKLLGMKTVVIKDRNDLSEKADIFARELKEGTVVYVHIKGPDEFGHDGDAKGKKRSIEAIDRDFFSSVSGRLDDVRLGVSCDHATPCVLKRHSADPVPLLVTGWSTGDGKRFDEVSSRRGSLGHLRGSEVLPLVVSGDSTARVSSGA